MQAVKFGWVGQTFALAKCSDSKGKKTRNRRTKEERKTMVESFINKYRSSNNGNFPSLNLTHKEVGGSFYTVREIVREIIQENRVLGPASLSFKEHNIDQGSDKESFGSLSSEPQSDLSLASTIGYGIGESPKEILFLSNDSQSVNKELLSTSGRKSISKMYELIEPEAQESMSYPNQSFQEGIYLNANWMDDESKDAESRKLSEQGQIQTQANEPMYTEISISEEPEGPEKIVESSIAKVISEDETVEPCEDQIKLCTDHSDGTLVNRGIDMQPINGSVQNISTDMIPTAKIVMNVETSNASVQVPDQSSPVYRVEVFPMKSSTTSTCCSNGRSEVQGLTETVEVLETTPLTKKVEVEPEPVNLDRIDSPEGLGCITQGKSPKHNLLTHGTSNFSESTDCQVDISHSDALTQQTFEQERLVSGVKVRSALSPYDVHADNIVTNTDSTLGQSLSPGNKEAAEIEPKTNLKNASSTGSGTDPVLDEISSESSKKEETNPVWTVIKAFIASFIKFCME